MAKKRELIYAVRNGKTRKFHRQTWNTMPDGKFGYQQTQGPDSEGEKPTAATAKAKVAGK
jgi:hypothetical protein